MTKTRIRLSAVIALVLGLAIGGAVGTASGWLSTARATITCSGATGEFLQSAKQALDSGNSDAVKVEVDALLAGEPIEMYEASAFAERMKQAARALAAKSHR